MDKSNRIKWLDFAKGFTIIFVLLSHTFQSAKLYMLSYISLTFIMPLFFAISGYLYKNVHNIHEYKILIYKKISSFVIPYIIFTFIIVFVSDYHHFAQKFIEYLCIYKFLITPASYLWFLYCLFVIFMIVGLLDLLNIKLKYQIIISIICLIIQEYIPWQQGPRNINPIAGICGYLLCFYLGYVIKKYSIVKYMTNYSNCILMFSFILWGIVLFVQYIYRPYCDTNLFSYTDLFTKLTSVPIFFTFFSRIKHNKIFYYFNKLGKYTLVIYLVHFPVIFITMKVFKIIMDTQLFNVNLLLIPVIKFILATVVSYVVSLLVCYWCDRYDLVNSMFYPRKYINQLIKYNYKD